MGEHDVRVFRHSVVPLLSAVAVCGIVWGAAMLMLPERRWLVSIALLVVNVPLVGAEWLRASQTWLLLDWNGITLSTPEEILFVSWKEAEGVTSTVSVQRAGNEYHVIRRGSVALSFDDNLSESDAAVRAIEEQIAEHRAGEVLERLRRGDDIAFGAIRLNALRLLVGAAEFPIETHHVERDEDRVVIVARNNDEIVSTLALHAVCNVEVIRKLIHLLRDTSSEPGEPRTAA